jgi:hypothetical protein
MDNLPKGQSPEVSEKRNRPGVYRHPETGAEVTCYPGRRAVAQADAFVRLGFKRVDDVPSIAEIKAKDDAQLAKENAEQEQPRRGRPPKAQEPTNEKEGK